ncbi:MAG: hypothetical protein GY754_02980 [bacterium]|nr:hypothetical protein [bacterium]
MIILLVLFASGCKPELPKEDTVFRFAMLGDSRGDYKAKPPVHISSETLQNFTKKILKLDPKPDMVFFNGDMVAKTAYRSKEGTKAIEKWLEVFLKPIKEKKIPVYIIPGNHIIDQKAKKGDNPMKYIPLFRKYYMSDNPLNGPENYKGVTYSFTYKNCHFATVTSFITHRGRDNTELKPKDFVQKKKDFEYFVNKENREWLIKDLQQNKSDFTLFFTHCPIFPVGPHYEDKKSLHAHPETRDTLGNILVDNAVDIYLAAHEHLYARITAGPGNPATSKLKGKLPQVIVGSASAPLAHALPRKDMESQKYLVTYQYLVADIKKTRIEFRVYDKNNYEIDFFIVSKKNGV